LVLCATARTFAAGTVEKARFAVLGGGALAARAMPRAAATAVITKAWQARSSTGPVEGWFAEELERNDWTAILEAGRSLGRFDSRAWSDEIDVPAAVLPV